MIIGAVSCNHDQHSIAKTKKRKYQTHTHQSDTLVIDHKAAIDIWVSAEELEKRHKQAGDTAFYTGADDFVYYSSRADSILEQKKLPIIRPDGYKYLQFVQRNGEKTLVKIDTLWEINTLYFFDPARSPQVINDDDIEAAYKRYF